MPASSDARVGGGLEHPQVVVFWRAPLDRVTVAAIVDVDVAVDQARHQREVAKIEAFGTLRARHCRGRTNLGNALPVNQNSSIGDRCRACAVDQPRGANVLQSHRHGRYHAPRWRIPSKR